MWKSIKEHTPRGNINILVTDRAGGFCIVRTTHTGHLPNHRFMMKSHSEHYYVAKGAIIKWIEVSLLRGVLSPDSIEAI